MFPYIGEASINIGLYSMITQSRLPLNGEDVGQNAYRVASLTLLPQSDNLLSVFRDGWHPAEISGDNPTVEWQWTRQEATLAFRNPKKDVQAYLEADSPGGEYHGSQQVQLAVSGQVIDDFVLEPDQRVFRKTLIHRSAAWGRGNGRVADSRGQDFCPSPIPRSGQRRLPRTWNPRVPCVRRSEMTS